MFNKILVYWGSSLAAILAVENIVISSGSAFIFIWHWKAWTLVFVSLLIWWIIWFWIKWMLSDKNYKDEDLNF